jgi:hypothetical protein
LNLVAAAVTGNGEREHTVDPSVSIITIDESEHGIELYPVVTIERNMGFAIVRDTDSKSGYRAETISFPVDKSQLQGPPHRPK